MQHFAVQIHSCPAGKSWIREPFVKVYALIMQCNSTMLYDDLGIL